MFELKICSVFLILVLPNFLSLSNAQSPRIAGGSSTQPGEFPSLASIRRFGIHYCGGSIVSSRWVLTAGHCIFNQTQSTIYVVVGSNVLDSGGVQHNVKSIVLHELYRYETNVIADNDIGMLLLQTPIQFGPFARRARLSALAVTLPGTYAILVGWGRESQAAPSPSNTLQQLRVKIISNAWCDTLSPGRRVVYSNMCSISPIGQGGCYGDSGTPLVNPWTGEQIGIYSWVVPPCGTGIPDGYTMVWPYLGWINLQILTRF